MKTKRKKKHEKIRVLVADNIHEDCTVISKCWCGKQMLVLREHGAVRFLRFGDDNRIKECRNVILAN